jgi:predicted DNA-binding transcriptional regulator AlpA
MSGTETLLTLEQVRERTARSTAGIYAEVARGAFPQPLKRGRQSVWIASEVQAVIDHEIATLPRMTPGTARPKRRAKLH